MNKNTFLIFLLTISLISNVKGDTTVVYDGSDTFVTMKIDDTMNNVVEYKYEVYLNNTFIGYYSKGENIFIPDNTNVTIYIPSPIKTDVSDIYHTFIIPTVFLVLGNVLTWGLVAIIIVWVLYKVWRDRK